MEKGLNICTIFLLVATYLMQFFHVPDPELLFVLPIVVCLAIYLWKYPIRITVIDFSLLFLWGYGLFSPSVNRTSSLISATDMAGCLFVYFLIRCLITNNNKEEKKFYHILTICIAILTLLALYQFIVFDNRIHNVSFTSLYNFRFLYRPMGISSNEWNALQWLWGGIVSIAYFHATRTHFKIFYFFIGLMIWTTFLLSFSRGGYIALLFCIILVAIVKIKGVTKYKLIRLRNIISSYTIIFGTCFTILTLFLCCHYQTEVTQTFHMNKTLSQQRSSNERLEALNYTKEIINNYPWGVGKGNYALANDYYRHGEKRSDSFTSYAGNIVAKILVEGGYIGLIIYCLTIFSIFIQIIRSKRRDYWIIFLFLLGFFIKELTFPTFYDSCVIQLSVFILLAYIQKNNKTPNNSKRWKLIVATPLVIWIGLFICRQTYNRSNSTPALIREYVNNHSKDALEKAILQNPMDVQLYYYQAIEEHDTLQLTTLSNDYPDKIQFRWTLYNWYKHSGQLDKAIKELTRCIIRYPRLLDSIYQKDLFQMDHQYVDTIQKNLQIIIQKEPKDVILLAKYGSIALHLKDTLLAEKYLRQANRLLPNLSRVWGNMATIEENKGNMNIAKLYRKRMNLIEQGIFGKEADNPLEAPNIEILMKQKYKFLFIMWYKTNLN